MIEEHKEEILQSMNGDTAIIVQLLKEIQEKENINNELTQKIDQVTLEEARKKTYLRRCEEQSRDGTQRINDAILKKDEQELEENRKTIAHADSLIKNLEDMIKQQEAQLQQKVKECASVTALFDDILSTS
ncbi:hypothetical protein HUJ05_007902 [Dendroctonus ponderosae]|nr:hypothetical protein HUJ05_007899 [Dendroctonus ponderosae]KAH1017226.1 hypothetical protein HUJ05_007902 [Dendroctonus ponderosae]